MRKEKVSLPLIPALIACSLLEHQAAFFCVQMTESCSLSLNREGFLLNCKLHESST